MRAIGAAAGRDDLLVLRPEHATCVLLDGGLLRA
jgi:hypothetical protein